MCIYVEGSNLIFTTTVQGMLLLTHLLSHLSFKSPTSQTQLSLPVQAHQVLQPRLRYPHRHPLLTLLALKLVFRPAQSPAASSVRSWVSQRSWQFSSYGEEERIEGILVSLCLPNRQSRAKLPSSNCLQSSFRANCKEMRFHTRKTQKTLQQS